MSISLVTPPPLFAFSADTISVKFTAKNYLKQLGVRSINTVPISSAAVSLKYGGGKEIIMSPASAPDDSGFQFSSADPAAGFLGNYDLRNDFDITYAASKVTLTAKVAGPGYDIAGFNTTAGVAELTKPNYSLSFRLFCENSDNSGYELIYDANLQMLYNQIGTIEAPIGDKLHDYIQESLRAEFPEFPQKNSLQCKKSCRRYYFEYAERSGDTPKNGKVFRSDIFTILAGGLSYIAGYNSTLKSLIAPGAAAQDRFLKQGNTIVYTRTNQPQFLYYFNTRETFDGYLQLRAFYKDGTTTSKNVYGQTFTGQRKYAFDVSFDAAISSWINGAKVITRYEVQLFSSSAAARSETRTFYVNYQYRQFVRYFLYWSSFGTMDTKMCYGKGNSEFEITQKEAARILPRGYDIKHGSAHNYDLSGRSTFKVATGFMSRRELILGRDFYLSAWKYRYSKGLMLPVRIDSKTIAEVDDSSNLYAQQFDYSYLFDDHHFTEGDEEDSGESLPGDFFFSSAPVINPTQGVETDPTIPSWVKSITIADIDRWNSGGAASSGGGNYAGLNGYGAYGTWDISILGNAATADHALEANHALEADHAERADYALDSDKWDGQQFADYLNQGMRTYDEVRHAAISSPIFFSGFTGNGWRIDRNGDATFENLTVRKEFNVYELVLNKISGTNGALAITDTVKILTVTESAAGYACTIDTADNTIAVPFRVNDLLRCQVWNGKSIKYYLAKVTSTGTGTFILEKSSKKGTGIPSPGDVVVRFGNTTNAARQGLLYLTASDDQAPYLDVLDGIDSDNLSGKTKVRLGKLDGIVDAQWGSLSGYGLYASKAYLTDGYFKGRVEITGGNAETITGAQDKVKTAFDAAKLIVEKAQTTADKAMAGFNEMASDDLLTPAEKMDTLEKWQIIQSEKAIIIAQAATYNVSSAAYESAFAALSSYLSPILTSLKTNTSIAGDTFRATFKGYYDARVSLLKLISDQGKVMYDNIKVGGANLIPGSLLIKMSNTNTNTGVATLMTDEDTPYYRVNATTAVRTYFPLYTALGVKLVSGQTYTYSMEVRTTSTLNNLSIFFYNPPGNITGPIFPVANDGVWKKIYHTGVYNGEARPFALQAYGTGAISLDYRNYKLETGNIATDWTPATADLQSGIDNANKALADIADDNLLTPAEKQDVLKEWQVIQSSYPVHRAQGAAFSLSTTDLVSKYNALSSYITPLLASLTSNSNIVGATFRANFAAYYATRDTLLADAGTAAKTLVENVKVGGRNYFRNSNFAQDATYWSVWGSATFQIIKGKLRVTATAAGVQFGVNLTSSALNSVISFNTEYTFSGRVTASFDTTFGASINGAQGVSITANTPTQFVKTGMTTSVSKLVAFFAISANAGDYFDLEYIKLEAGNKATDWTLSPEDLQLNIDTVKTAAETASKTADGAFEAAKAAGKLLAEYSDDNLLVPAEKQDVLKEWLAIKSSYPVHLASGAAYGVTTADFTSNYNTLSSYLSPLLAVMSANSTIAGDTFRANFSNFYLSRDKLLAAITVATKTLVENVKVGGRNYFRNSNFASTTMYWQAYGSASYQIINGRLRVTATAAGVTYGVNFSGLSPLISFSTEYTFSGKVTTFTATTYGVYIAGSQGVNIAANTPTQFIKTGSTSASSKLVAFLSASVNVGDYFELELIKFEAGNRATDWTLAPEDVQANIEAAGQAANLAAGAAGEAKIAAKKAQDALDEIANDNLLTPSEKYDLLQQWQVIQGEKPVIVAQAGTYGLSTAALDSVYNTLNSYLSPLLASFTLTSAIVGTTFRANYKAYFDAKTALLRSVSDKAAEIAEKIQQSANKAAEDAQKAKDTATNAQILLADIADDNKLVPSEKQDLALEVTKITGEYGSIIAQANTYGLSTANYQAKYNALVSYANPLIANLNTTTDINGAAFRGNFANYFSAKQALMAAISDGAKALADANTNLINGKNYAAGRMMLRDPEFAKGNNGITAYNNTGNGSVFVVRQSNADLGNVVPNSSGYFLTVRPSTTASPGLGGFTFQTQSKPNGIFTVRMLIYMTPGQTLNWGSNATGNGGGFTWNTPNASTGGWQEFIGTLKCGSAGTFSTSNYFYLTGGTADIYLASATVYDMTAAEYDFKALSDEAKQALSGLQNETADFKKAYDAFTGKIKGMAFQDLVELSKLGSTVIEGGSIRTTLLNTNAIWANIINAGYINAGQIEALNVTAKTLAAVSGTIGGIQVSGNSVYSGNGNFSIDSTGKITAKSGTIGGLNLSSGSLYSNNGAFTLDAGGNLIATSATLTGIINAKSGTIGGFEIGANYMQSINGQNGGRFYLSPDSGYIAFINDSQNSFAGIGDNVLPPSSGVKALARFENNQANPYSTNYAAYIKASGGYKNVALYIADGTLSIGGGQCIKAVLIDQDNYQITDQDYAVISNANTNTERTIYAPSSPLENRTIRISNRSPIANINLMIDGVKSQIKPSSAVTLVYLGGAWYTI